MRHTLTPALSLFTLLLVGFTTMAVSAQDVPTSQPMAMHGHGMPMMAPATSQPASQPTTQATVSGEIAAPVINERCPIMGLPINPEISVEYQGQRVYFCCNGCPDRFLGNPEPYLSSLPQFAAETSEAAESN
ncbi:YHS domain-containing protein [Candidatus Sumerlaeota bacterium]|nr:YHS domain-containing protein [Candidatus Sumerlaeota bacterium]